MTHQTLSDFLESIERVEAAGRPYFDASMHHDNCDTLDPFIRTKPCNCRLESRARVVTALPIALRMLRMAIEQRDNLYEVVASGCQPMPRMAETCKMDDNAALEAILSEAEGGGR